MGNLYERDGSIQDILFVWNYLDYSEDSITLKSYSPDGNGGYGPGYYGRVSETKAKHHGLSRAQMRNKTDYDFLSNEEADHAREIDIWVMTHRRPYIEPEEKLARNGKNIWYHKTVIPNIDADNTMRGTITTSRDITKRVEAQLRAKRLLKFLVKRMYLPMIAINPIIKKLGPEHRKLSFALKEMLARLEKILSSIN